VNTHEKMNELLVEFALQELSAEQTEQVRMHLGQCHQCRQELKELQAVLECSESMRGLSADDCARESAKQTLSASVANEEIKEPPSRPNIPLKLVWRTIMKSPITKLAAAAAIIIAVLIGIQQIDGSGVAWAELVEHVEQIKTVMYQMKATMKGLPGMPSDQPFDIDMQAKLIYDYGFRIDSYVNVENEEVTSSTFILFDEGAIITVVPKEKQYMKMTLTDDLLAKMKKENGDPRTTLKEMMKYEYTKLGSNTIDGIEVEGIEITDPAMGGGMFDELVAQLWCDVQTDLPVLMTMKASANNGEVLMDMTIDSFQWGVEIDPREFEPNIPEDYKLYAETEIGIPEDANDFVETLKFFAEYANGRYPSSLTGMTVITEFTEALKRNFSGQPPSGEPNEVEMLKIIMKLQTIGMTYAMMVKDANDPAYYGDRVTAEFPHAVLMRWKVEAGNYRVIFADLTVAEVTADELAELEAAPLNIKPTAIKPHPADGAAVATFADVELSWMPGAFVNEHKVYFDTATDQLLLLADVIDACSVTAPALEKATTYYWRVDEVQPDGTIAAGDVWSFDTGKLVGWWKLDGDANDSSGNGNHGTVNGDPNWVVGRIGGALQFDGVDDSVQTDYATDLPAWTVAVWVNSPAAPSSAVPSGPVHRQNNLQINWNHTSADFRGVAGLRVADTWYAASFGQLEANKWYHLAATYDGENLKAYKNGVLITDNPDPSGAPDGEWSTLKVARHSIYEDHFEGTIDDVRIYSYDLSADEVASIYAYQPQQK